MRSPLNPDDLEFTLAVARQRGSAWHHLRKQASLSAEVKSLKERLAVLERIATDKSVLLDREIEELRHR